MIRTGTLLWLALACLAPTAPARAEPLTAERFDALTLGTVMDTFDGDVLYGIEEFLPGRRVIWQDAEGCMRGTWDQVGDMICFDYEDRPDPVCWVYEQAEDRILGWFQGDRESVPISLIEGNSRVTCDEFLGV